MNIALLKEKLEALDEKLISEGIVDRRNKKALVLDLSDETHYDWQIPDRYLECYISGPALAARLWAEFAGADVEDKSSYEANNPIVMTSSAMSNSGMPSSELVSIAFRSPVSGTLCFNVCTNTVGMRLEALGYCALIITGRLRRPTVIDIKKSGVTYNVSELFIGYTVSQIEALVGVSPMTTAMSIGPAGEQKVPFATVVCEGACTGRGGLGCLFGYKNIKSLCITGFDTAFERTGQEDEIKKAKEAFDKVLSSSEYCHMMQRSGSSCLVKKSGKYGWAPVLNFSRRTDPRLFHLGGDEIRRRYGEEHGGCVGCPILCRHRTTDGIVIPGYEAILMLGSNIGCFDLDKIIERYAQCVNFGLDPVSTGNVLGWACQATSSGQIVLFEPDFSFTDNSRVLPLIEMIARRTGPGEPLSFGTYALGQAFKDSSYAYTIRGLECGPYDYRGCFSQSITDCMGLWFTNRFEIDSTVITRDYADWAVLNESMVMGLESYGVSSSLIVPTVVETIRHLGMRLKFIPKSVIKRAKPKMIASMISAYSGSEVLAEHIIALGERCWRLIYEINIALGFNMIEDTAEVLPEHFYIDPESNHKEKSIVPYRSLIERYCFLRKNTIALQSVEPKAN
ncbi:MAG: hypothetical protein J6P81_06495 [Spirochaetales bacterium]|nr:hypothetical protein [Spirochaetales bacterium]